MTAFVLGLIWRQLGSVSEAARILKREGFLWSAPVQVSQQALCERLHVLPPGLFAGILHEVLPLMQTRAQQRQRPLPRGLRRVQQHFAHILALDGSTLDGLLHKTGLLREEAGPVLGGCMAALLDLVTRLPRQVWFEDEATANDLRFWDTVIATMPAHSLLVIDGGFRNYQHFDELTEQHHGFITPLAINSVMHVETLLTQRPGLQDALVALGQGKTRCQHTFRVVTWQHGATTYRCLAVLVSFYGSCLRQGQRDYALHTGRRAAELASLQCGHLHITSRAITIQWPHLKGGQTLDDSLPLTGERCIPGKALQQWLRSCYGPGPYLATAPVWPIVSRNGSQGQAISARSIANLCEKWLGMSQVHTLRHTFAKTMEEAGAKVSDIQARLGHTSLAVTGRYLAWLNQSENVHMGTLSHLYGIIDEIEEE